jgi:hypothetical protein
MSNSTPIFCATKDQAILNSSRFPRLQTKKVHKKIYVWFGFEEKKTS